MRVAAYSHLYGLSGARVFQHSDPVHHVEGHVTNLQCMSGVLVRTPRYNKVGVTCFGIMEELPFRDKYTSILTNNHWVKVIRKMVRWEEF